MKSGNFNYHEPSGPLQACNGTEKLSKKERFSEQKILIIKCVIWFAQQLCPKHFAFYEEFGEISEMYIGLHEQYLLLLSDSHQTWFFDIFSKNPQVSNWMKILPVEGDVFHANTQTQDETNDIKLIEWEWCSMEWFGAGYGFGSIYSSRQFVTIQNSVVFFSVKLLHVLD
jgi:hypothetical protein